MIWAPVGSRSCFCWLYRASASLAAKNIINLILVLTIWWCPRVVIFCVVEKGCLLWPVHSLGKALLAFTLFHFVLQGQTCLLLQVSLDIRFFLSCGQSIALIPWWMPRGLFDLKCWLKKITKGVIGVSVGHSNLIVIVQHFQTWSFFIISILQHKYLK